MQHKDLDIAFEGTIIGIVGRNGSGKSNLLGSIQFVLTGEQTGLKKAELLSWGTDEGWVELEFEHNGTDGFIRRSLHNASASFKFGTDMYQTASAVNEGLRIHLNMDKDLVRQAVFVRQAEIDSILFSDARTRELAFQRLLGIGAVSYTHLTLPTIYSV